MANLTNSMNRETSDSVAVKLLALLPTEIKLVASDFLQIDGHTGLPTVTDDGHAVMNPKLAEAKMTKIIKETIQNFLDSQKGGFPLSFKDLYSKYEATLSIRLEDRCVIAPTKGY